MKMASVGYKMLHKNPSKHERSITRLGGICSALSTEPTLPPGVLTFHLCQHGGLVVWRKQISRRFSELYNPAAMAAETDKVEPTESEQDEEEDVYEVERIIDMRVEEVWLTAK